MTFPGKVVKGLALVAALGAVGTFVLAQHGGGDGAKEGEHKAAYTIGEVMEQAHKSKLMDKVIEGKASDAEKRKLLDLYLALWDNKPPRGEMESWKAMSGEAIVAAAKVVLDEKGAIDRLETATDCRACHNAHKPPRQR